MQIFIWQKSVYLYFFPLPLPTAGHAASAVNFESIQPGLKQKWQKGQRGPFFGSASCAYLLQKRYGLHLSETKPTKQTESFLVHVSPLPPSG